MKVNIGPYKSWFGPYQLAELLCFWAKRVETDDVIVASNPNWVHKFGEWLAHGDIEPEPAPGEIRSVRRKRPKTWLYRLLLWIDSKRKRKIYVRIDRWDTWSLDETLAHIIYPMLKQLQETKHGAPFVEDEDVPEQLRSTAVSPKQNEWDTDDNHFKRWDWVLDEMIFAFGSKLDTSWEEQFHTGEVDLAFKKLDNGMNKLTHGPNHTIRYDREGKRAYEERIQNGFRLFGKYFQALWD